MRFFLLFLLFTALINAPLSAQTSAKNDKATLKVTITGQVIGPDGKPAPNAELLFDDGTLGRANSSGRFTAQVRPWQSSDFIGRVMARTPHGLGAALVKRGDKNATIRLQKFVRVSGRVVDESGAGVPNVSVQITMTNGMARDVVLLSGTRWQNDFSSRTDAQGLWLFPNVPAPGSVRFQLFDPRFARAQAWQTIRESTGDGPTLTARPGANFSGRVVYEDGRPASGFRVSAQPQQSGDGWGEAISGTDGKFIMTSLPTGAYNVCLTSEKRLWVAKAIEGALAQPGETKALGDFTLTRGVLLQGRVVDAATGNGISGANIGSYGAQNPKSSAMCISALSDAQGRFQLRVPPGETYVYIMGPSPGYIYESPSQTLNVQPGENRQVDLKLRRGATLRGVAVDAKGKPLSNVALLIKPTHCKTPNCVPQAATVKTDAKGQFDWRDQEPGTVQISADTPWQVVRPTQATLKVGQSAPLRVVLRAAAKASRFFKASAVTTEGKPLLGVEMRLEVGTPWPKDPHGYSVETYFLNSDAKGRFAFDKLRPKQNVQLSLSKPGYRLMSGAQVTDTPAGVTVSPAVFARLDGKLSGQVLDENGAPAAGAWFTVLEDDKAPHQLGADGRFNLEKLPRGPITLLAARGQSTARFQAQSGQAAQLKLSPAPAQSGQERSRDIERGAQILESIARDPIAKKEYYAFSVLPYELAPFDVERALQLARLTDVEGSTASRLRLQSVALKSDPDKAAKIAALYANTTPSAEKFRALLPQLNAISAAPVLAEATTWLAGLEKDSKAKKADFGVYEVAHGYLIVAALIAKARQGNAQGEAMMWVDKAIALAKTVSSGRALPKDEDGAAGNILQALASLDAALFEKALDKVSVGAQAETIGGYIADNAGDDLPLARRLLGRLRQLPGRSVQEVGGTYNKVPEWAFGLAAKALIVELGKTDPAEALLLAREVKSTDHRAEALALAARFQPKEQAAALLREAGALASGHHTGIENLARFGGWVYEFDPALAREFWKRALILRENNRSGRGGVDDIAFYMARDDAAQARLLLESAFMRSRAQAGASGWSQIGYAMAMCAVDVDRALEMAAQIPTTGGARFEAQRKIAQYLLATPETRRTLAYNRWGASDTWRPGTPTHW